MLPRPFLCNSFRQLRQYHSVDGIQALGFSLRGRGRIHNCTAAADMVVGDKDAVNIAVFYDFKQNSGTLSGVFRLDAVNGNGRKESVAVDRAV